MAGELDAVDTVAGRADVTVPLGADVRIDGARLPDRLLAPLEAGGHREVVSWTAGKRAPWFAVKTACCGSWWTIAVRTAGRLLQFVPRRELGGPAAGLGQK